MKILITGSSGFVGSHLLKNFKKDHEVIGYDLKERQDILDIKKLSKYTKGVDVVVHLAALVSGPESWEKPHEYFTTNGIGTLNVIKNSIKSGVKRVIFASSAAVYGGPLTPYGASKKWAEILSEVYGQDLEIVVLRPFNIFGEGQNPAYGYAIHNFIKGIRDKGEVFIYGDGLQTRDFIFIDDVVDVLRHFISSKLSKGPIDVGTGKSVKIKDLAETLGRIMKKDFKITFLPPKKEPYESSADTTGLKKSGLNPENFIPLEEGLIKLLGKF